MILSMFAALTAFGSFGSVQPDVFAQNAPNSGQQQLYNAANGNSNASANQPNTPQNVNNRFQLGSGINLLWLIPLMAIPVVFLMFRLGESTGQNMRVTSGYRLAGVKGGKTLRKRKTSTKKAKTKKSKS